MEAAISTIAAFRDRWNIGDDHRSLGPDGAVKTIEAAGDRKHAQAATDLASRLYRGAADARGKSRRDARRDENKRVRLFWNACPGEQQASRS